MLDINDLLGGKEFQFGDGAWAREKLRAAPPRVSSFETVKVITNSAGLSDFIRIVSLGLIA